MTQGTPSTANLIQGVIEWIEEIGPSLDPRNVFLARVSRGVLGVVARELAQAGAAAEVGREALSALLETDGTYQELWGVTSDRIRDGSLTSATPGLVQALRLITLNQLAIDQPKYRYDTAAEDPGDARVR